MGKKAKKIFKTSVDPFGLFGINKATSPTEFLTAGIVQAPEDKGDIDTSGIDNQAAQLEQSAKEAEAKAAEEARIKAKEKLAKQTKTVFTSGLGLLGSNNKNKTKLGG